MTDQLSEELEYSQALVRPLLGCLQALSKRVVELGAGARAAGAAGPAAEALRLLLSNVQLVASIFYSLNSPGLTDVGALGALPCRSQGRRAVYRGREGQRSGCRPPLLLASAGVHKPPMHALMLWWWRHAGGAAAAALHAQILCARRLLPCPGPLRRLRRLWTRGCTSGTRT